MIKQYHPLKSAIKNDQGAALVAVMMLVMVISGLAVMSFDLLAGVMQSALNNRLKSQTISYALMAEHLAARQAIELSENDNFLRSLSLDQQLYEVRFPIENGMITGALKDQTNCFNLNALVLRNDQGRFEVNEPATDQYQALLRAIGLGENEAERLTHSLVDWQDSDARRSPMGAEDGFYQFKSPSYLAANAPLKTLEELSLVEGYSKDLIMALANFVCLDGSGKNTLNVNKLELADAPLLAAMLGGAISLEEARLLIQSKPNQGYDYTAQFWAHDVLRDKPIDDFYKSQLMLTSHRFLISANIQLDGVRERLTSVVALNDGDGYDVLSRQFGK